MGGEGGNAQRRGGLKLTCAAEGGDGEGEEEESDEYRECDEPVGDIAGPGAEGGIEPTEGEDGKDSAGGLMKELFEDTPEATEAAEGRRGGRGGRRHRSHGNAEKGRRRDPARRTGRECE